MNKFRHIGQPVRRLEDEPLVRGRGRFVDDIHMPGMLEAAFVRSSQAHAVIRSVDFATARKLPGVHAVLGLADLRPHLSEGRSRIPSHWPLPPHEGEITPVTLVDKEAVFVGEPIAVVVAESRYIAEDAAALVEVDCDVLPAVADCKRGVGQDSPLSDTRRRQNTFFEVRQKFGDVDGAFAKAPRTLKFSLKQQRGGPHPIEGRGLVASYEPNEDLLSIWTSSQHVHESQSTLINMLGLEESQVRMLAPDVGGGFGAKFALYPEEIAVSIASRILKRPIKWIEDRREQFLATIQERDQYWDIEVAYDEAGRLLGARGQMIHDQGAYMPHGLGVAQTSSTMFPNVYNLPAFDLRMSIVQTNKPPTMAVRGAGHPQAIFAVEHALDRIACALGLDRAEVRRRNLIQPEQLPLERPIKARSGLTMVFDSGDFPQSQQKALDAIGYSSFPERQKKARSEGRYIGVGMANGIKGCGRGPYELGIVRIGRSGRITVHTGASAIGQGVRTAFAQICAEQFGVDPRDVTVVTSDTTNVPLSLGAFNSRQTILAGSAVHHAAITVRKKALKVAAHLLEAAEDDLEIKEGRVEIRGAPGSGITLAKISSVLAGAPGFQIPGGFEPGLESTHTFMGSQMTFGLGSHAVEVEVDIHTGNIRIVRYIAVHDTGQPINPMMVRGQIVGGVVHGIGNALFEWMGYDDNAQPITTSLAEYLLPSAPEVPFIEDVEANHASLTNPLGVKGIGESGTVPAVAAIVSAIENALEPFDVEITEVPVSPQHIFDQVHANKRKI
jgi:carbon-monoxide dehydrogenase large subunit